MAGLGLILAGAAAGMGNQMVENARTKREEALRAQERQWQVEDRQQERDWRVQDRDMEYGRQDASTSRAAGALGDLYGTDLIGLIDATEGGADYDTLFGHSQREGSPFAGVRVSDMTLAELYDFSDPSGEYGSWVQQNNPEGDVATPMGRYQIVGSTLRDAAEELGLPPDTVFTKDVQDQIAAHLAERRLASADTIEGKRAALRNEWAGFRNVPDDVLDAAIRQYESGGSVWEAAVDPNVPSDVRGAIGTGLGIGVTEDAGYSNEYWRDNGDGTETRMGTNSRGQVVEITSTDGQLVVQRNSRTTEDRDNQDPPDLKSTTMTRIEELPAVTLPGTERDPRPDPNLVAVVADEVLRLMQEEDLSETQAYNKAIRAMVFDTVETRPAENGIFSDTPAETAQRFTGKFNYGDEPPAGVMTDSPEQPTGLGVAAGAEPAGNVLPAPTNQADRVVGQTYRAPDGRMVIWRGNGWEQVNG